MKKSFDDIVPKANHKKGIRSIPVPSHYEDTESVSDVAQGGHVHTEIRHEQTHTEPVHKRAPQTNHHNHSEVDEDEESDDEEVVEHHPHHAKQGSGFALSKKQLIIAGSAIGIVALGLLVANAFEQATLIVTPKTASIAVNGEFQGNKSASALEVPFEVVTLTDTENVVVRSNGEKQVEEKASGKIAIFNAQSTAPQKLIANTRFEDSDGLIFRIKDSVTVPGKTTKGPGRVDVTVYADQIGNKYNIGLSDFTIPGFKGDPRYKTFYGRSVTAMVGGFSGVQKMVSDEDKAKADSDMKAALSTRLLKSVQSKVPSGYVLFDKALRIDYKELPSENLDAGQVRLTYQADLSAAVFKTSVLSSYLARQYLSPSEYAGEAIEIKNMTDLKVEPVDSNFKPLSGSGKFSVSGTAQFVWVFDGVSIKQSLLGKNKDTFSSIIAGYKTIERADLRLSPFWKSNFPKTLEDITIENTVSNKD